MIKKYYNFGGVGGTMIVVFAGNDEEQIENVSRLIEVEAERAYDKYRLKEWKSINENLRYEIERLKEEHKKTDCNNDCDKCGRVITTEYATWDEGQAEVVKSLLRKWDEIQNEKQTSEKDIKG